MPLYWVLLVFLLSASFFFDSAQTAQDRSMSSADLSTVTVSMLVYRNAVANYLYSNPAASGVIPDGLLNLPSWYVKPQGLNNVVVGAKSYTFYSLSLPGLAGELAKRTESFNVGTNQNGVLLSPNLPNSGIALPAQVPNGSVVLIQ
jgi:hypothetical protein